MSAAPKSVPAASLRDPRLLKALMVPAALAAAGIGVTLAGLLLIAVNGDKVGFRRAALPAEQGAEAESTGSNVPRSLGLRPGLDLK